MRGRVLTVIASAFVFGQLASAADPAEAAVVKLAAPRYAEREKAARDLVALGEPALKVLRAAQASSDEEVRARATALVDRIELTERSRRLLAPPTLALLFADYPLDLAINEFAKESGVRMSYSPVPGADPKRRISLDTGKIPYWKAVEAFYQAAGLTEDLPVPPAPEKYVEGFGGRGGARVIVRTGFGRPAGIPNFHRLTDGTRTTPAVLDRAVRVRALPASFPGNKYDDIKGELTVLLDVDAAPTLNFQGVVGIEVRHAAAEDGRALSPAHPTPEAPNPIDYAFTARQQILLMEDGMLQGQAADEHIPVVLKSGGLRPRALSELSGVVMARVLTPPEPVVTVENLLDAVGRSAAADHYKLEVLGVEERSNNRVAVRARLTTEPPREEVNFPVLIKGQARNFLQIVRTPEVPDGVRGFQVIDAAGKPVAGATTTVVRSTSTAPFNGIPRSNLEVLVLFPRPAEKAAPVHLAYTARRSVLVELPFTLKDVPVP